MAAQSMRGQFNSPITLPPEGVETVGVSGPLDVGDGIHEATIVCVLVQGEDDPVWVEGSGHWEAPATEWTGSVSRTGRRVGRPDDKSVPLQPDDKHARGIAIAIAVKDATEETDDTGQPKFVPPSIVTLTWCVDVKLVEAGSTSPAGA
jgi:hypothetical protein